MEAAGAEPDPVENDPGDGAEPVPNVVEPLPEDFWARLRSRSGLIHEIVDWIVRTAPKKQRLLAFGNTIAALGALLGRRVRSPRNARTNLYVFGIAGTARGKEHSRQCISSLFVRAGLDHWLGSDKWKSDSGIRTELLKAPAHLAQVDEFGKVLAQVAAPHAPSHLAGIVTTLLELFGRSNGMDLGPAYADQKARPREIILEPNLSVYATSVPSNLFAAMSSKDLADGFLNRWICLFGEEQPEVSDLEESSYVPPVHLVDGLRLLEKNWRTEQTQNDGDLPQKNMPSVCPEAHVLPKSPDALARGRQLAATIEAEARRKEQAGDPLADMWLRVPETVDKLAVLIAATSPVRFQQGDTPGKPVVATWDGGPARRAGKDKDGFPREAYTPSEITVDDVDLAADLVTSSFRRFELEVGRRVADSEYEAKLKKVLRILIDAGTKGITQRDFTRKLQWLSARERDDILKTLGDSGQCVVKTIAKADPTKAGRPVTNFWFAGFAPGGTKEAES